MATATIDPTTATIDPITATATVDLIMAIHTRADTHAATGGATGGVGTS